MARGSAALLLGVLAAAPALAGSVRQDVYAANGNSLDAWFNLGQSFGGVGYLRAGTGTFVGLNQAGDRGYVLTAAHVVSQDGDTPHPLSQLGFTIPRDGNGFVSDYEATNVYVPNAWDPADGEGGFRHDIAIVEVRREQGGNPGAPSTYIDTISGGARPLYLEGDEQGRRLVIPGVGGGGLSDGTELFPNFNRPNRLPMAFSNVFDDLAYDGRVVEIDFDDPGNADGQNRGGGSEPVDNFEGLPIPGDSGSSMFIEEDGVMKIAAVTTFNGGDIGYGGYGGGTRLAPIANALRRGLELDNWTAFLNIGNEAPGDFSADGLVGAEDLDILLANWGKDVSLGNWSRGDGNADGLVNNADLQLLRDNWGEGSFPDVNTPEPGTLALFAWGGVMLAARRRRR